MSRSALWAPHTTVEVDAPLAKRFHARFAEMLDLCSLVSVLADADNAKWRALVLSSRLLETERLCVRVARLPEDGEWGLRAAWLGRSGETGELFVEHRSDCVLAAPALVYVVLGALQLHSRVFELKRLAAPARGHPPRVVPTAAPKTFGLSAAALEDEARRTATERKAIRNFARLSRGAAPEGLDAWAALQIGLASAHGGAELGRALDRMDLLPEMRQHLSERAASTLPRLQIGLAPVAEGAGMEVSMERVGDDLRIVFHAAPSLLSSLPGDERWAPVAWAFATWVAEGDLPGTSLRVERRRSWTALESVALHARMSPCSPIPLVPSELTREYGELFRWLSPFAATLGRPSDDAAARARKAAEPSYLTRQFDPPAAEPPSPPSPAWMDIGGALMDTELAPLRRFRFPLRSVRYVHRPGTGDPSGVFTRMSDQSDWGATLEGDVRVLASVAPIELLEALSHAIDVGQAEEKDNRRKPFTSPAPLSASARTAEQADVWTWLRLLWRRERHRSHPEPSTGAQFLLGSLRARGLVSSRIVPALKYHHAKDAEGVTKLLAEHPVWIVDYTDVSIRETGFFDPKRVHATRVSIVAASGVKLVHFDGLPDFDPEGWTRIVRVVLRAPPGFTWLEPRTPWRTNRIEIVADADTPDWYGANQRYRSAGDAARARYRAALALVREKAAVAGKEQPTPWSTAPALKTLFRALAHVHHPDKRGTAKDEDGVFQRLQAAFRTLDEFHPA